MSLNIHNLLKNHVMTPLVMASAVASTLMFANAQAKDFKTPDVLMIGDSQLSFGTGKEMIRFFDDFENRCERHVGNTKILNKITQMRKTLIGARSTSLRSWFTEKGAAYDKLCEKDPDWGVNASIWGHMRDKTLKYIQIGETEHFDFCKPSTPPLTAAFQTGYDPKLLLINVLGNAASKWAGSPKGAVLDLKGFLKLIPEDLPCVYIATMPSYTKKRNDRRFKAQNNLKKAMNKLGNRCTFVDTLDANTMGAIQSKAKFFRRDKKGKVKDPFHPQQNAAELVLKLKEKQICQAVVKAVLPHWGSASLEVAARDTHEDAFQLVKAIPVPQVSPKVSPKIKVVDEVKVDSEPIAVSVSQEPKETAVEKIVREIEPEVTEKNVELATKKPPIVREKIIPKVNPVFLMVKTLPDGEKIENHKMALQVHVASTKTLEKKPVDFITVVVEKLLKFTLQEPNTVIRGSVDLHFTNGEISTKLVHIKSLKN